MGVGGVDRVCSRFRCEIFVGIYETRIFGVLVVVLDVVFVIVFVF